MTRMKARIFGERMGCLGLIARVTSPLPDKSAD